MKPRISLLTLGDANLEKSVGPVQRSSSRLKIWGGYAGYSRDPDGHVWEIAWNPANIAAED
jgi:predicted lactoylglutathione lyase